MQKLIHGKNVKYIWKLTRFQACCYTVEMLNSTGNEQEFK